MAVLKDLIVHGSSRFLNAAYFNSLAANKVAAEEGVFNKLIATNLTAEQASITDLTAQNARVVGLLDVQGELHTNAWTNANIANIGGSFYISPTVEPTDGTTTISITRNSATSWTIKASGTFATDFIKSGDATSGVVWPANSLVLITGDIEIGNMRYPLGTLKGTLSAQVNATAATTSKEITITGVTDAQNRNNPSVLQELYELNGNANISSAPFKNGKISLYKLGNNPIGILMTSMGTNSNSLIDIYGGVSTGPTVRIGHLGALSSYVDSAGNTRQPKGWGIYTDNGYFKGVIVADSGSIGHFTINSKAIYSGSHDTWNKSNTGIFLGTNDSNYYISGGSGASWWIRDDGRFQFGGTNGITYNGTTLSVPAVSVTGTLTASQVDVSGIISAGSIVTNTLTGGTFNTADYIRVSTQASSSLTIGTSGAKTDWRIIAGKTFGVDKAGNLYATSANITGTVDATSFTAKYYNGSSLSRQMALTGDGLKLMDGSGNILSQINGTASTIGQTTGNNYNINITDSAIDLRYNTNILNRINNNSLTIYDGSGTADTNIRAKFGTTIQLGKSNSDHIKISTDGLEYFTGSTRYARFGAWARIGSESGMHLTASGEGLQFAGGNGRTVFNVCLPGTTTARYITDRFNSATAALLGTPVNSTEIRVRCGDSYIETMYEFTAGYNGTETYNKGNSNFTITYNANTATITASGSNSPRIKWVNYQANFPDLYTTLGIRTTIPGDGENPSAYYTPGLFSLVQGIQCRASGLTSVALNYGTIADGENQTAIGEWNKVDTTNLFIVGNGASDSNRSNALAVARDGNLYIKGQVYVGCNADSTGGTQLGGVTGVKGNSESTYRTGQVNLTAANIGAVPTSTTINSKALTSDITLSASDVGAVPTSRTINSKALSSNISLTASDVGAVPTTRTVNSKALSSNITLTAADVSAVPTTRTVNSKALSSNISLTASDVGAVPTSRTVNSKALSSNITLSAADVSAIQWLGDLTTLGSGTPAAATQTYWVDNISNTSVKIGYNTSGGEKTLIFSRGGSANYGSVLSWGYTDTYLRIMRRQSGSWKATDWEKISAGYADSAGYATSAGTAESAGTANAVPWQSAITACGETATKSLTTTEAILPMTTHRAKLGTDFEVTSNGIKCVRAGWILVAAEAYYTTGFSAGDLAHLVIKMNSTNLLDAVFNTNGNYFYFNIAPKLYQVSAGTMIYLYARNQTAARGTVANNTSTTITAVYIA